MSGTAPATPSRHAAGLAREDTGLERAEEVRRETSLECEDTGPERTEGVRREPSREREDYGPERTAGLRRETSLERLDRNLDELTGELRVVVTGVQVLFAFLLVVPFDSGFAHAGGFERTVYLVTLLLAALAAVCTIAPSAQHRFLFRHDDKRFIVFNSNRVVIAGLVCLALAMCGSLLLVTSKLFGIPAGVLTACASGVPFTLLWFLRPLARVRALERHRARGDSRGPAG